MSWFKLDIPLVNTIRSGSLIALDKIKPIKQELFGKASGFRGNIPQLLQKDSS